MANSTFASRAGKSVQKAENKAVQSGENKTLDDYTKAELVEMARDQELEGYSTMNKSELVDALGG